MTAAEVRTKIAAAAAKVAQEWWRDNKDNIERLVVTHVHTNIRKISDDVLGITHNWNNEPHIEYNSALYKEIKETAMNAAKAALLDALRQNPPLLTEPQKKEIRAAYARTLKEEVRSLAYEKAREDAANLFDEALGS